MRDENHFYITLHRIHKVYRTGPMKKNVLFLLLLGLLTTVSAQPTHRIKGTVIDKASRQPLEFINVLVLGLGRGGVTDAEGYFNIGEVPPGIYRLQASAVGYKTILTPELYRLY